MYIVCITKQVIISVFIYLHSKQDHPGSPLFCHDHSKIINENKMKIKSKEIYNGLVGIAFETQEKDNLEFTQFVNVQGHRVWIESIVNGKEIGIQVWSRSMDADNHRIARGNSRTNGMNFSLMIWFNFIFMFLS